MQVVAANATTNAFRRPPTRWASPATGDVEPFLEHAMDAVILVNDFDQHAPVAIVWGAPARHFLPLVASGTLEGLTP
jgi:hypothetical protein